MAVVVACEFALAGCGNGRVKSGAELDLNPQQTAGRATFDHYCAPCHSAYSSSAKKGPPLKGLFHKQFLPSGLPANDRFVGQTIATGRGMMPPFADALTQEQVDSLLAYLHTL
jgi:mono/diheme cytochrome c family protein